ncbi:MAG: hypothetical protein JSU87_10945 [Gemmatimonadota bacterium]|nr:MAG: hypothetical protein JSU87_10945 [Gemmatimonadota bacterium]
MTNAQDEEVKKKYHSYKHWKSKGPSDLTDLVKRLRLWMEDIDEWGRLVRKDIQELEKAVHRLEEKVGLTKTAFGKPDRLYGDPGDPPDPPWRPGG